MDPKRVTVVGGGLAGSEAAWQIASRGVPVTLLEMRPEVMGPAHATGYLAELVCSNSFGSTLPDRALGVLKAELRLMGSLVLRCAEDHAVPAGGALAVARDGFAAGVTAAIGSQPLIRVEHMEVTTLPPQGLVVLASGPLTSPRLAEELRALAGQDSLSFYDAMAPVVSADSIDMGVAFRQSRYGQGMTGLEGGDYINCPLDREQYYSFVDALLGARQTTLRGFETDASARRFFEACLPVEVLAARDRDALAFGPMRPVGLRDPRTGQRPFAVVQLRQDDAAGSLYNLVGFQTNLAWAEQETVLRLIPGLERAEFVRLGQMHRNTYLNSPRLVRQSLQWHDRDDLLVAGQLTGTEGYVGSTASGLIAGINAAHLALGRPVFIPPRNSLVGALLHYITHADPDTFQPMKANFGLLEPLDPPVNHRRDRHAGFGQRALDELAEALVGSAVTIPP